MFAMHLKLLVTILNIEAIAIYPVIAQNYDQLPAMFTEVATDMPMVMNRNCVYGEVGVYNQTRLLPRIKQL